MRIFCRFLRLLYQGLDMDGVKKVNSILTRNQEIGKWIYQLYKRKADGYSPIGVDTDFFNKRTSKKPKKWWNDQIIFHSTDYTETKGTRYLLYALPYIIKKCPNVKLLISNTTDNLYKKIYYKKLVSKYNMNQYVEFVGTLTNTDMPKYYSFADVVCFCGNPQSKITSTGLTVLEAMACGIPVVRSNGTRIEVIHGKTGFLTDPRSPKKYASYVIRLLNNPDLRNKLGNAARKWVVKKYKWNRISQAFHNEVMKYKDLGSLCMVFKFIAFLFMSSPDFDFIS